MQRIVNDPSSMAKAMVIELADLSNQYGEMWQIYRMLEQHAEATRKHIEGLRQLTGDLAPEPDDAE